jgi:acylphosphatase
MRAGSMRVRLLIRGNVQGVGFRALVKQVARSMGVKGVVRNLLDGDVEVYCEGSEELLGTFRGRLRYKGDPVSPFSLHVQSIEVHPEGEDGYGKPPETWEPLDIDYGDSLTTFEREMLEITELVAVSLAESRLRPHW